MKKIHVLYIVIFFIIGLFIWRLYYLQLATDRYKLNAINTSIKQEVLYPNRGDILDRNGKLLVSNSYVYELDIIPAMIGADFDTAQFCELAGITTAQFHNRLKQIENEKHYRALSPYPLIKNIPRESYARIQEQLYLYPSMSIVKRPERKYLVHTAGNILGYINEANERYIKTDSTYYEPGDLVGIAGVEKSYEKELRGVKGVRNYVADRLMKSVGSYKDGEYDRAAKSGKTLTLTIDYDLQLYAEELLQNKRGAIVALDPKTGEILAMASAPTVDPNRYLTSIERNALINDSVSMANYDRVAQGSYPPGSPFKLMTALAAMEMGVISDSTTYVCKHGFRYGRMRIACHCGQFYRPIALRLAIAKSCNNYFSEAYIDIVKKYPNDYAKGVDEWKAIMNSFGLGVYMNNDLAVGSPGLIPSSKFYDKRFGLDKWNPYQFVFNAIGQGDITLTPLQMANFTAVIANKGHYFTPHIVKGIDGQFIKDSNFIIPKKSLVNPKHFTPVLDGMAQVFTNGTARSFISKDFTQAGKTGTAQNPQGQDHSLFTLIAPVDDPQIVIAVVVENGYWGARWAGPMASLIAEKHLTDTIKRPHLETRMKQGNLEGEYRRQWINYLKKKGWYVEPVKKDSAESVEDI
ncbi:penicillin-binding protein 2 [Moheibacter sediminis]|uniref:Penicillin-binding protein 2 n=1 Tax=Moheibacter sediminis TaxID=1434700 RepID=A0A1W2CLQ9_9FLAO|nr:penicillin-binding protein 2 [Moheibacter sediminis]SMC86140.1 penicillin-binding protein 2 [Moheibacter sediminis]